ncbi:MAG TPA: hypothetical protein VNU00_00715 [Candidatus Binataceae bacterium]|jgi:hypothetical protein|nr:hypothetical protein [Candidatus Binataceae bacterium]
MPLLRSSSPKLQGFFLELVRKSFGQLGMGDHAIVEYVASVLTDFSHSDRWLQLHNAEGRRLTSTVEMMLTQSDEPLDPVARVEWERTLRKYVGDYTLFMSGLFRRFVERGGYLGYYLDEGARAYQAVSELDVSLYRPGFLVFEELGKSFENYSGALDFMQKCYFTAAPNDDPFAGFFNQIQGWVRHGISRN